MRTSMPDKAYLFSDSTCDRLVGLLLRGASVDASSTPSVWLSAELDSLANEDAALQAWLQSDGDALPEQLTAGDLCRRLIHVNFWRQPGGIAPSAARLHDCAFTLLRLQGFQASFAEELESRQRQLMYNLAYGLSHELNNPLANIVTRAGVLAQRESDPQHQNLLQTIIDSAHRGREMLGDLMLLARPPELDCQPHALQALVLDTTAKIAPWCDARDVTVELLETDDSSQCKVIVDRQAIAESLWAIVRNSLEAMSQGGRLDICSYVNRTDQRWGVIEISDTGPGLSAVSLKNCFDPFYSGREAGRGLGMGLSKARALLDRQQGHIEIENLPTTGCRVTLWLPAQ